MKSIVLFCVNGMSSSLIVKKIQEAADNTGYDAKVISYGAGQAADVAKMSPDVVLLSPQIRFMKQKISAQMPCPVGCLDMATFGKMNGEAALKMARDLMGD